MGKEFLYVPFVWDNAHITTSALVTSQQTQQFSAELNVTILIQGSDTSTSACTTLTFTTSYSHGLPPLPTSTTQSNQTKP
jgi:hypothetical protein